MTLDHKMSLLPNFGHNAFDLIWPEGHREADNETEFLSRTKWLVEYEAKSFQFIHNTLTH